MAAEAGGGNEKRPEHRRGTEQDAGAAGIAETADIPTSSKTRAGAEEKAVQDNQHFDTPDKRLGGGYGRTVGMAFGVAVLVAVIVALAL